MAASKAIHGLKHVKPILSMNHNEAKTRAIKLYRAWYRQIPYMCEDYDLDLNVDKCRLKLRNEYEKNRFVNDVRVIDMLCVKGQQDLDEVKNIHKQRNHVMTYFNETVNPKPEGYLAKFYAGHDP